MMPKGITNSVIVAFTYHFDLVVESSSSAGSLGEVSFWPVFVNPSLDCLSHLLIAVFGLPFEMAILIPLDAIPFLVSVPDITNIDDSWCADDLISDCHVNIIELCLINF